MPRGSWQIFVVKSSLGSLRSAAFKRVDESPEGPSKRVGVKKRENTGVPGWGREGFWPRPCTEANIVTMDPQK